MSANCSFGPVQDIRGRSFCLLGKTIIDEFRNLNVKNIKASTLYLRKNANIIGDLIVNGNTNLNSLSIDNSLSIEGPTITDSLSANSLVVNDHTKLQDANVCGNLVVLGTLTANIGINMMGNCILSENGMVEVCATNSGVEIDGSTIINGSTILNGEFSICGNTNIKGTLDVTNGITAMENVMIMQDLIVNADTQLGGDLEVMGNIIGDVVFENGNLCSTKIITNEIVPKTLGQDITVDGNLIIIDELSVTGNSTLCGNLEIKGNSQIAGDLVVAGNVFASNLGIETQDEGSTLNSAAKTLNFTGAGVTATNIGSVTTINVPPGSGGTLTLRKSMSGAGNVNQNQPFTFPTLLSQTGGLNSSWGNNGFFTCPTEGEYFVQATYLSSFQQVGIAIDFLGTTGWGGNPPGTIMRWRTGTAVAPLNIVGVVSGSIYMEPGDRLYFFKHDSYTYNGGNSGGASTQLIIRSRF